jgi:hypothetical protein
MSGEIEELLAAADEGRGLLSEDNIPDENQSLNCFSCGEELVGLYCHACGNKNDNYRRSIFSLIIELLGNITAVDSRMWRSLWSLIAKPGRMAREFSDGARTRWTSPVRMYLATSLLLFGYIAVSGTQLVAIGSVFDEKQPASVAVIGNEKQSQRVLFFVKRSQIAELTSETAAAQSEEFIKGFLDATDDARSPESLQKAIDELNQQIASASTAVEERALIVVRDELVEELNDALSAQNGSTVETPPTPETAPATSEPETTVTAPTIQRESNNDDGETRINLTGTDGQTIALGNEEIAQFYRRIVQNPEVINDSLNSNLKFAMFFMLPFAMLLGAFFIRGRNRAMLYDHLVHAAYVHAFSFLLLFVFILLSQYTPLGGLLAIYTLILLVYLPISAKGMFGRGWFKSFLTAYGVGAVYTLNMMILSTVFVVMALSDVASQIEKENAERARLEAVSQGAEMPETIEPPSTPDSGSNL